VDDGGSELTGRAGDRDAHAQAGGSGRS
jgi:hypothetical protein